MRIEIHVQTEAQVAAAREKYRGTDYAGDDVVIIVDQPVSPAPAARQDRKLPKGDF